MEIDLLCMLSLIYFACFADHQHARLVKYYRRMGFEKVLEVGSNGLSDLPHLLVWGGAGTRMNCNPEHFLRRWAPLLNKSHKGSQ